MEGNEFPQVDQGASGNPTRPMCRWWAVIDKSRHALDAGIPVSFAETENETGGKLVVC